MSKYRDFCYNKLYGVANQAFINGMEPDEIRAVVFNTNSELSVPWPHTQIEREIIEPLKKEHGK